MTSTTYSFDDAIAFLLDAENDNIVVPAYVKGQPTQANENCIAIYVAASVDCAVDLIISNAPHQPSRLVKIFDGNIYSPHNRLSVVNSNFEILVSHKANNQQKLVIWADTEISPTEIFVQLCN